MTDLDHADHLTREEEAQRAQDEREWDLADYENNWASRLADAERRRQAAGEVC